MRSASTASTLGGSAMPLKRRVESRALNIVYLNIIFYALAFWMCVPVIPFLSKKLGADPVMFGYLQTFAGLAQLVGGPLLGWLVDVRGARFAMSVSQVAGGLSYFMLATAWNIPMLFFSKIPTIFMHALQSAQMCVTLMGDVQARPKLIARLSSFYGIGFVCGPMLGGFFSRYFGESGHQAVALLATIASIVSVVLNYRFLPPLRATDFADRSGPSLGSDDGAAKSHGSSLNSNMSGEAADSHATSLSTSDSVFTSTHDELPAKGSGGGVRKPNTNNTNSTSNSNSNNSNSNSKNNSLLDAFLMFMRPELRLLLVFSLLANIAITSFYTTFSLAAEPRFGMDEQGLGAAMSFIGGLSLVVNAFAIPLLNQKVSMATALYAALALLSCTLFSLGFVNGSAALYAVLPGLVLSTAVFRAYSVTLISMAVPKEEAGSAIGLSHAAGSLSSVVAPAITGHLFGLIGFQSVCVGQALVVVVAAAVLHSKVPLTLSRVDSTQGTQGPAAKSKAE